MKQRWLGALGVALGLLALAPAAWASGTGVPVNAVEGVNFSGPVATFSHPVHTATISWGDGGTSTFSLANGSTTVTGSHTYAEEGSYDVIVTETGCTQPPCEQARTTATVSDASLSATGQSFSATAGTSFSGQVATFSDADPGGMASDYLATIDWGDGSSSAGAVAPASSGGFTVSGSHTYDAPGSYTVTVTIRDQGGATASASGAATVSGFAVSASRSVSGDYIRFDASGTPASHHAVAFGWDFAGAGTPQAKCGGDQPVVYHAFTSGIHTVSLFVTESTGTVMRYERTITITGPPGSPSRGRVRSDGFHLPDALLTAPLGGPSAAVTYGRNPAIGFCPEIEPPAPPQCEATQNAVQFGLFDAVADPGWCEQVRNGARGTSRTVWKAKPGQVVRVNGVDLVPAAGVSIVLSPSTNQVTTEGGSGQVDAVVHTPPEFGGDIDLGSGRLNWRPAAGDTALALPDFPLPSDSLLGFALDGTASVQLVQNAAAVTVHLRLPSEFQLPGGGTITGEVTIGVDNADGARLDGLDVEASDLFLGALEVTDFGVSYRRDADLWEGHGSVVLPSGTTISAKPPAPYGFALKDGHFDHAGAIAKFDPGILLAGGITLNSIGAALGTHPTYFRGDIGLRWFELVHLDGSVELYFATPGEPLRLFTAGGEYDLTTTTLLTQGHLSLQTPFGDVDIADAYLNWLYPDYVEFGGSIDYQFFPGFNVIEIKAGFHANAELLAGKFDIEGDAQVCVIDGAFCGGGDFVLSSHGVGGCFRSRLGDYGADYEYGGSIHLMFYSCDASAAREVVPLPHAADVAAGARLLRIRPGLKDAIVGVKGQGGAPYVTLTGPRGETVSTPYPSGAIDNSRYLVARSTSTGETFFVIGHPSPGLWKLTPMAGSVPIAKVEQGYTLAPPSVHATVTGRGRALTLHYAIRPIAGQTVQFVEQGKHEYHVLGSAHGNRGALRFTPGAGPAGRRTIEAKVYSYGTVRKVLAVTSYLAPGPAPPPTPRGVRARRAGQTLIITWSRTAGTQRFGVAVVLSDGRRLGFVLRAALRSVRVARFGGGDTALVRVMALAGDNLPGRQVSVRVPRQRTNSRRHRRR